MKTLEIIKYLIEEIEEEIKYNEAYVKAKEKAEEETKGTNKYYWYSMPEKFKKRDPRKSVIKGNAKKIRQLLLKFY